MLFNQSALSTPHNLPTHPARIRPRRWIATALIAAIVAGAAGCVAVSAKHASIDTGRCAVAMDGRVYLIDTRTGEVQHVDVSKATPFRPKGDSATAGRAQ
ncbi:MAG: hypothetical protein HRU75_00420 [Planctomycetia bacterium]|nr:MAG: hypothetical protein HRU75_00420 [Planctomycetia bacterium]